jgi:hypothetical protein
MKKTLSSPLVAAANNIVSLGSRSNSLPRFQRDFNGFSKFLEVEKRSLEKLKLPDKKKIKALASLNIASNFGRPGNLLGSLFSGALDLAGFVGNMFPGRGKLGKPQRPSNVKPPKPTIKGPRLKLGGMRAVGVGNALFAGLDFATGLAEGESVGKAAAGAGGALAGGLLGGVIGQTLIPIPGLGFVIGNMAGSFLGGFAADRVYEGGSALKQKLAERLKGQEGRQKGIASGLAFKDTIDKFDAAVNRFEKGVAMGLFGSVSQQMEESQDVASDDYVESGEDQQLQTQDETTADYGQLGGTFESHIKEFREFRNKQFGASKEKFPTPNPQLYQIRELGIWEGGKRDNWKINPLADDTAYEKDAHKGAGHWENRAFDIPVPNSSKEGDMVAEFWRKKGYNVIWRSSGHYDHVHVELPKEKANDFFAGKLKPEDKKTNMSSDKNMMEGNVSTRNQIQQMSPQQGQQTPVGKSAPSIQLQSQQVPQMSSMVAAAPMNLPVAPQNIQYYTSYNQPGGGASVIMPIMMGGGGGGQQRPVYIPVGGGGGGGTVIMPGPTEGQVVNSLMKTMLLTNLSST